LFADILKMKGPRKKNKKKPEIAGGLRMTLSTVTRSKVIYV